MQLIQSGFIGMALWVIPDTTTLAASREDARLLTAQCAQCHGTNGTGMEHLAGKPYLELLDELLELKYKDEPPPELMHMQARGYTDQQLEAIADYLSKLPAVSR